MSRSSNVLDLLAKARPPRLDPPSDQDEHTARAVAAIVAGSPAPARRRTPGRRHARTRVAVLGSVGVTAAAAVTAVAVGVSISNPAARTVTPDAAPPAKTAPLDAGGLLLAAAERSDQAAQDGGRYRTFQSENGYTVPVETANGRYTMIFAGSIKYWLARARADKSWVIEQSLGGRPASAADEAAWRRHGSPTVVKVTGAKGEPGEESTRPDKAFRYTVDPEHIFSLGDRNVTQKQLEALPTDPAKLRALLLARFRDGGGDLPHDRDQWLLKVGTNVVIGYPVSNAVRAAAYRMLAMVPGVRALGAVRDVRGRTGQAVAFEQDDPSVGRFEVRLIIDLDTGQALSLERRAVRPKGTWSWLAPGALATYELILVSATTNDGPPKVDVRN